MAEKKSIMKLTEQEMKEVEQEGKEIIKKAVEPKEAVYSVKELAQNSKKLFGVQPECLVATLFTVNKKEASISEARKLVKEFIRKEIQ